MEKPTIVMAFDIETRGKSPMRNGILAVGLVIGTIDGEVLHKTTWKLLPLTSDQIYEERCLIEFWNMRLDLKTELEKDAQNAYTFASEFRSKLDDLEKECKIYLVSDNPTFDAGFINYYLDHYGFSSVQYGADGKSYRLVHDSDNYARGVMGATWNLTWPDDADVAKALNIDLPPFTGTKHMPADDAEHIYRMHLAVVSHVSRSSSP